MRDPLKIPRRETFKKGCTEQKKKRVLLLGANVTIDMIPNEFKPYVKSSCTIVGNINGYARSDRPEGHKPETYTMSIAEGESTPQEVLPQLGMRDVRPGEPRAGNVHWNWQRSGNHNGDIHNHLSTTIILSCTARMALAGPAPPCSRFEANTMPSA